MITVLDCSQQFDHFLIISNNYDAWKKLYIDRIKCSLSLRAVVSATAQRCACYS